MRSLQISVVKATFFLIKAEKYRHNVTLSPLLIPSFV